MACVASSTRRTLVACWEDSKGVGCIDNVDNVVVDPKASKADQVEQTQEGVEEEDWPPSKRTQRPADTQQL